MGVFANVFDVHFSSFPFKLFACRSKFISLGQSEVSNNLEPEKPDTLEGQTSPLHGKFILFTQANCLIFITIYTILLYAEQWFLRDKSLVPQDESLVSWGERLISQESCLLRRETRLSRRESCVARNEWTIWMMNELTQSVLYYKLLLKAFYLKAFYLTDELFTSDKQRIIYSIFFVRVMHLC